MKHKLLIEHNYPDRLVHERYQFSMEEHFPQIRLMIRLIGIESYMVNTALLRRDDMVVGFKNNQNEKCMAFIDYIKDELKLKQISKDTFYVRDAR